MPKPRVRDAAKKAVKDRVAIAAIVCYAFVTIVFAHRVSGDEALKILFGSFGTFVATVAVYMRGD